MLAPKNLTRAKRLALVSLGLIILLAGLFFIIPYPQRYQDLRAGISLRLLDRTGQPLRNLALERSGTDQWVPLKKIPLDLISAVLVSEDKRFYYHFGIDPIAAAKAGVINIGAGKIVLGASTITQQLLRTLAPPTKRDFKEKLQEAYWALRTEARLSKAEILEAYLNRVAFGPTVYGVQEASRYYFDKPAQSLSLSECALLAVLIRAPSTFNPWDQESRKELKLWTDDLLSRLAARGLIAQEAYERAKLEEWVLSNEPPPFAAPHFCQLLLTKVRGKRGDLYTSLDLKLQHEVEGMIANHLKLLKGHQVGNAAAIVVEVDSGEVLALVGSADFSRRFDGQFNAAVSLRQPGSTVKPFTYALLLDSVGSTGYILPDLPIYSSSNSKSYIPQNYDGRFKGPVSIRTALANSLNVPAVRALELVGTERLLAVLKQMGWKDLTQSPEHYGLGLTLGDGSASLWQLAESYRCLARQGLYSPLSMLLDTRNGPSTRALSAGSALLVTNILSDSQARKAAFSSPNPLEFYFPVAVKTGTSKGYRDNWCLGYTPKFVVGVWVGNSSGSPMQRVSGITGAAPLFHDIMQRLGDGGDFSTAELKMERVCALSGKLATNTCPRYQDELCLKDKDYEKCDVCRQDIKNGKIEVRFKIDPLFKNWALKNNLPLFAKPSAKGKKLELVYPLNGDIFLLDADLPMARQKVRLKAVGGTPPYKWLLDDKPFTTSSKPQTWWKLAAGRHKISISDSLGEKDSLNLSVTGLGLAGK